MTFLASRAKLVPKQNSVHEEVEVTLSTPARFVADGGTGSKSPDSYLADHAKPRRNKTSSKYPETKKGSTKTG